MNENNATMQSTRDPVLNPVDRVSEMLFGLFMALTFVGAVSVTESGTEVRALLAAALGCNLAWGLVDAVMYLVRTITDRGKLLTLVRSVRAATAETAQALIKESLSKPLAGLMTDAEVESVRQRIAALPSPPERPKLKSEDLLAALAVFLLVVASTFPVAIPFLIIDDIGLAKTLSRAIALVMLFFGGLALGRYAGYGSWKTGLMMAGLGSAVVAAVMALGG